MSQAERDLAIAGGADLDKEIGYIEHYCKNRDAYTLNMGVVFLFFAALR